MISVLIKDGKVQNVIRGHGIADNYPDFQVVELPDELPYMEKGWIYDGVKFFEDPIKKAQREADQKALDDALDAEEKPFKDAKKNVQTLKGKALSPAGTLQEVKDLLKEILVLLRA